MKKGIVNINEISKLRNFMVDVSSIDADIDAVRNKYVINAKSIMGMMSLDLSTPIELVIYSEDEDKIKKFDEMIERYQ